MAEAAVVAFGVSTGSVACPAAGDQSPGAFRGYAPDVRRSQVAIRGAAHPYLVSQPPVSTSAGHIGRSVCGSSRKEAAGEN
jgi:hypothetical protein